MQILNQTFRVFDFLCTVALHIDTTFQRVLNFIIYPRVQSNSPKDTFKSTGSMNEHAFIEQLMERYPTGGSRRSPIREVLSHTLNDLLPASFVS